MDERSRLFSLMSSAAAESLGSNEGVDELEYFDEFSRANRKIENLNVRSGDLVPSEIKSRADEALSDASDEKFKRYLDRPSIETDASGSDAASNSRDLEFFETRIKDLKVKSDVDGSSPEIVSIARSIEEQLERVKDSRRSLERLFASLDRMKSSMSKLIVDPKLNENVVRDLAFEDNVKRVCEKINDLNKYTETKKKIIQLCRDSNCIDVSEREAEDELPAVISMLLKDFEIAIER